VQTLLPAGRGGSGEPPLSTFEGSVGVSAEGKSIDVDLRYRLASANEPVQLPSPHG
jgi:hypothetical protein